MAGVRLQAGRHHLAETWGVRAGSRGPPCCSLVLFGREKTLALGGAPNWGTGEHLAPLTFQSSANFIS